MSDVKEAEITIDGVRLSVSQSMTVRVALSGFSSDMSKPDALGNDEHGLAMAKLYHDRAHEVLAIIIRACNRP